MGERCLIVTKKLDYGVYLHYDGEPHSVIAALRFCELAGYEKPEDDPEYGFARLVQTFANHIPGAEGVGITSWFLSPGESGIYVIENWRIIGWYQQELSDGSIARYDSRDPELLNQSNVTEILRDIYWSQPEKVRKLVGNPIKLEVPESYIEDMWAMEILPQRLDNNYKWVEDDMHPRKKLS